MKPMAERSIEIRKLATDPDQLDDVESVDYLLQLLKIQLEEDDVDHLIEHIRAIICKELALCRCEGTELFSVQINQAILNVAFRSYYQILDKYCRVDQYFLQHLQSCSNDEGALSHEDCIVLYFVLQTNGRRHFDQDLIKAKVVTTLSKAVDDNDPKILMILKTLNILFKMWSHLDVANDLLLDHIYFCLQSNQLGMRDEMITIMQHACSGRETALLYFTHVINFWPWTNRNKLYMLGCILNNHEISDLLVASSSSSSDFFNGLRSTLNYKSLLAPSQYVIKALSGQRSRGLLNVCMDILESGTLQELRNFNMHWSARLLPCIDVLFEMTRLSSLIDDIVDNGLYPEDPIKSYRLVVVFGIFSKEILRTCPQNFSKIIRQLQSDIFDHELETQLLIFKLIVDNLASVALNDWIDFMSVFIGKHMHVENAQFRNAVLGKIPLIINQLAKTYGKSCLGEDPGSMCEVKIVAFFQQLQSDIMRGICGFTYQPKIFGLKLLEILMKSLYGQNIVKNAKSCCIKQNQRLAEFLKQQNVFNGPEVCAVLMRILNDPSGFDDVLQLIVSLIAIIHPEETLVKTAFKMSTKSAALSDVDESNLSGLYARVAIENCSDTAVLSAFLHETFRDAKMKLSTFAKDPLYACESKGCHLFSSLIILNEMVHQKPHICVNTFWDMLLLTEDTEAVVLKMLNSCNNQNSCEVIAASFEDIDKSLEILVSCSEYTSANHEISRKYLLMSFWLTLKACCDLSASMCAFLILSNMMGDCRLSFLKRCLQVIVTVLTKCRHKGAIESAGVSIGKVTEHITSHFSDRSKEYDLLHKCVQPLYDIGGGEVSTTRRGAGFSIMFLHIVKNERHRERPILRAAIRNLLKSPPPTYCYVPDSNCDRIEALHLHYLCVLVRDTELKEAMARYHNEIMMAAISQIDDPEWTIRNGALQLFGALVPKIVGQRQANEFERPLSWEPAEVTFCEVTRKLKEPFGHILNYCLSGNCSTSSIILYLEFLNKVEYIYKSSEPELINAFRELVWCLLRHHCEKVRFLSAKCFVRSHEFSTELPHSLKSIATILFSVNNENFFEGLVQTLYEGISKFLHDSKFVIPQHVQQERIQEIRDTLERNFSVNRQYKLYTLCKLWDMLRLLSFGEDSVLMETLRHMPLPENPHARIAADLWLERVKFV